MNIQCLDNAPEYIVQTGQTNSNVNKAKQKDVWVRNDFGIDTVCQKNDPTFAYLCDQITLVIQCVPLDRTK